MTVKITYRRTTRLSMRIAKNGDVLVSAPYGLPRTTVTAFINEHQEWIAKAQHDTINRENHRQQFYEQLDLTTPKHRTEAVRRLQDIITPYILHHAEKMHVKPAGVTFRANKSKWGSCNVKTGHICFSIYLLLLPNWCIEHVVVHELAHLIEPSHNARFHAIMDQYYPRWREAREATRKAISAFPTTNS